MSELPTIDYIAAWAALPAETQARIGALAIKETFLRFAGSVFEGVVVYLDDQTRDDVTLEADEVGGILAKIIEEEFPDLFGATATPDDPNSWSDPAWATPFQIEPGAYIAFTVVEEARFDR